MDNEKVGALILELRKEKGMTQSELAEALGVCNKTVSKWECGRGCPDVSLWDALAGVLGADLLKLLRGSMSPNQPDVGKINRTKFYRCPYCGNILTSTSKAEIACCGRTLHPLAVQEPDEHHTISVDDLDNDYFVHFDHPMTKDHYILFVAYVTFDAIYIKRLYPEQDPNFHLPVMTKKGTFYYYCSQDGLMKAKFPQ